MTRFLAQMKLIALLPSLPATSFTLEGSMALSRVRVLSSASEAPAKGWWKTVCQIYPDEFRDSDACEGCSVHGLRAPPPDKTLQIMKRSRWWWVADVRIIELCGAWDLPGALLCPASSP